MLVQWSAINTTVDIPARRYNGQPSLPSPVSQWSAVNTTVDITARIYNGQRLSASVYSLPPSLPAPVLCITPADCAPCRGPPSDAPQPADVSHWTPYRKTILCWIYFVRSQFTERNIYIHTYRIRKVKMLRFFVYIYIHTYRIRKVKMLRFFVYIGTKQSNNPPNNSVLGFFNHSIIFFPICRA